MEQLITTVMAVALLAVLGALGVNYGSEALQAYQAKSEAAHIVADAQSIAAAWKSYARGNNGNPALNDYCWGSAGGTDLVTAYLSHLPKPPASASSSVNYYYPAVVKDYGVNGSGTKVGPTNTPADTIALQLQSPRTCSAIAALGGYSGASAIAAMSGDLTAVSTHQPYDCLFVDTAGTGAPAQGDAMLFIYRVFDQNNFTTAARSACP